MDYTDLPYSEMSMEDVYEILREIEEHHNIVISMYTKTDFEVAIKRITDAPDEIVQQHCDAYWTPELRDEISDHVNQADALDDIAISTIRQSMMQAVGASALGAMVQAQKHAEESEG